MKPRLLQSLLVAGNTLAGSTALWSLTRPEWLIPTLVGGIGLNGLIATLSVSRWHNRRIRLRMRYHADTPPSREVLQQALTTLLVYGPVVIEGERSAQGLRLWIEIAERIYPWAPQILAALPDLQLEPSLHRTRLAVDPPNLRRRPLQTYPGIAKLLTDWLGDDIVLPSSFRLMLFSPTSATLLVSAGSSAPTPTTPRRILWLERLASWPQLYRWALAHYPWEERWPTADGTGPQLEWPSTTTAATTPFDTVGSYHLAAPDAPLTITAPLLGWHSQSHTPIRVPQAWQGHLLSLGHGDSRYSPLPTVVQAALQEDRQVVVLDPTQRLTPCISGAVAEYSARSPYWVSRTHPAGSVRLNLLAADNNMMNTTDRCLALVQALTHNLPLFEHFLTQLGISPRSPANGEVLIHDMTLILLLHYYRLRLLGRAHPHPTLYTVYTGLQQCPDIRIWLRNEVAAWTDPAAPLYQMMAGVPIAAAYWPTIGEQLAAASTRWEACARSTQLDAAKNLVNLLEPIVAHPGWRPFWENADIGPSSYFNRNQIAPTLTQLLPPHPTGRDGVLARWYAEYIFLNLVAARTGTVQHPAAPLLLLLDDIPYWWRNGLLAPYLADLAHHAVAVCGVSNRLPAPPEDTQLLDSFATWWIYRVDLSTARQLGPELTAAQAEALPLTHLPDQVAVLRSGGTRPILTTVYATQPEVYDLELDEAV